MAKTVSGTLFKKMVTNGALNLKNNFKEIDHLNVFPVPDGDTGTNMQMTMMAGVKEVKNSPTESIQDIDRKSTRLNSSHVRISYAVFCLKKKKKRIIHILCSTYSLTSIIACAR